MALRTDAQPRLAHSSRARWRSALIVAAMVPLLVPALGRAELAWQAPVQPPATVTFSDVAAAKTASGTVVVAGGVENSAGVVYRLLPGGWKADVLPGTGKVTEVGVGGGIAWAIAEPTTGTAPLLFRLGDVEDAAATWTPVDPAILQSATSGLTASNLTALGVASDGTGVVGATDGHLASFPASGASLTELRPSLDKPITGVTLTARNEGFVAAVPAADSPSSTGSPPAGSGGAGGASTPFFQIAAAPATMVPTVRPQVATRAAACGNAPLELTAIAAAGATAVAIDTKCLWNRAANGNWRQQMDTSLGEQTLNDISVASESGVAIMAIAGGSASTGVVWRRTGTGPIATDVIAPAQINAVSVLGSEDIWAVGVGGVVRHFAPAPPQTQTQTGDGGSGTGGNGGRDTGPETPSGLKVTIDDPNKAPRKPKPGPTHTTSGTPNGGKKPGKGKPAKGPKRLLRNVTVKAIKGGLAIEFDLNAPAKVAVAATRGARRLGSTKPRVFGRGHGRIVLRYGGGKPPTNLRITARRSTKKTPPAQTGPGKS